MIGFLGQYQATLDEKGRILLPSKLRSVKGPSEQPLLDGDIILTQGLDGCLGLYPVTEWEAIQNRLSSLDFTQRDFRLFSRRFYPAATVVNPDKSGRILVPAHLLSSAALKKEVMIIGMNRWVEIWNPELYRYHLEQHPGSFEEVADRLFSGHDQQKQ